MRGRMTRSPRSSDTRARWWTSCRSSECWLPWRPRCLHSAPGRCAAAWHGRSRQQGLRINPAPRHTVGTVDPATMPATPLSNLASDGDLAQVRADFTRLMMEYKFGMDEIETKISILQEEFTHLHDYNPIEHVLTRLKTPESILEKVRRRGLDPSFAAIRDNITDVAGVR